MPETGAELLISSLEAQQHILVGLLGFWERRIQVERNYIGGLEGIFPLLLDILPADTYEVAIQPLADALGKEIAQRQDALKKLQAKLQAAHKVFPVKITQHDSQGGTRTVFAREIEWLKKNEADLNIEEQVLEEDKTTAELASREPKRPVSSLMKRAGLLHWFRNITGPAPTPSPQIDGWYTIADLHFRHRVFAINLKRDELKTSIEERSSEWVTALDTCARAMKNMLITFADAQVDLAGVLSLLGSDILYAARDDMASQRTASFTLSIEGAILKWLLPPQRYINFRYQQLSAMPIEHATHVIVFGCSVPETKPKTGSPQANAVDAFYYLLRQPYQPDLSPTSDVSMMAHLFEQYWSLSHNRERSGAPAPGTEWQEATPDLVLHFLRCLPTPLLPIPPKFESRKFENQSVVDELMEEWGRTMEKETPRTHILGAIRKYTIPYLGARTEGHISFLRKLAVALTHRTDCYWPVNRLLCHEHIGEMTWQWI